MTCPHWRVVKGNDITAHNIYERHYSCKNRNRRARSFSPGWEIVLLSHDDRALFVWNWQKYGHIANRPYCLAFRNEGSSLAKSSELILSAEKHLAQKSWIKKDTPPAITFVCPAATKGDGKCFKAAGWIKQPLKTKTGLIILTKKISP